jgi:hypothetical protein
MHFLVPTDSKQILYQLNKRRLVQSYNVVFIAKIFVLILLFYVITESLIFKSLRLIHSVHVNKTIYLGLETELAPKYIFLNLCATVWNMVIK